MTNLRALTPAENDAIREIMDVLEGKTGTEVASILSTVIGRFLGQNAPDKKEMIRAIEDVCASIATSAYLAFQERLNG